MRPIIASIALCGALGLALPAPAQTQSQAPGGAPMRSDDARQPGVRIEGTGPERAQQPEAGANSFTEGQARSRIEDAGYTDVTGLQLDDRGIWRGRAMRSGQPVDVALDYRGNVIAGPGASASGLGTTGTGATGAPAPAPSPGAGGGAATTLPATPAPGAAAPPPATDRR